MHAIAEQNLAETPLAEAYKSDGFASPVPILTQAEAAAHRAKMEAVEAEHGPLHYVSKVHTILDFAADLATHPAVLDTAEQLLGPDMMLFDVTYIVKEPQTDSFVSWHQDLTYWGLSSDEQVTLWLALSPANERSGCMRMIPGSHKQGKFDHEDTVDNNNVLFRGQSVAGVSESDAVLCPLSPGEASFHHGWTLHASMPNASDDRRIGFNVQFIAPSVRQLINKNETATLVRGEDRFGHYQADTFATGVMEPAARERHAALEIKRKETWASA
jgi:ectoine hydroxylase-related dioxygenase (phytanoyl-CoA dioxygenase family)